MDQWEIDLAERQERRLRKERMRLRIRETLADTDLRETGDTDLREKFGEKYVQLQKIEEDIDREITELKTIGGTRIRADQHFWRAAKNKVSRTKAKVSRIISKLDRIELDRIVIS